MKKRDEYIAVLHQKIDEWNNDIDRLKENADKIDAESRVELLEQIQSLKDKRDEMETKATKLGQSGAEAWEDIKSGLDLAWESMNVAVKSATSRFSK